MSEICNVERISGNAMVPAGNEAKRLVSQPYHKIKTSPQPNIVERMVRKASFLLLTDTLFFTCCIQPGLINTVWLGGLPSREQLTSPECVLKAPGAELSQNACGEQTKKFVLTVFSRVLNKFRAYLSTDTCFQITGIQIQISKYVYKETLTNRTLHRSSDAS